MKEGQMSQLGCRLNLQLAQARALTFLQMNRQAALHGKAAVWVEHCELT